jgi:uncharacterized protein
MQFIWRAQKYLENIEKHQVDFVVAVLIFESDTFTEEDTRHDYGEKRYRSIGAVGEEFFVVVFTERDGKLHIISARRGGRRDRRRYCSHVLGRGEASL